MSLRASVAGLAMAACVATATVACNSSPQPATVTVDPVQVLKQGGAAMGQLKTVSASLKFTKGKVSFQGFALAGAKTSVRLPSDSDTVYNVKDNDLAFNVEVVIAGGRVFVKLPLSTFQELTGSDAGAIPDLAKLFDPATGLPAVIPAGHDPKYAGTDTVDGAVTQMITATYTADQVHAMLSALSSTGDIKAEIWVDTSDHLVRKATLDGAFGDGGQESVVEVDISGFNSAVQITSPSP